MSVNATTHFKSIFFGGVGKKTFIESKQKNRQKYKQLLYTNSPGINENFKLLIHFLLNCCSL